MTRDRLLELCIERVEVDQLLTAEHIAAFVDTCAQLLPLGHVAASIMQCDSKPGSVAACCWLHAPVQRRVQTTGSTASSTRSPSMASSLLRHSRRCS